MRERHDPDLEDQAEKRDVPEPGERDERDTEGEGIEHVGAASRGTVASPGSGAGVGAAPLLNVRDEDEEEEDERLE